MLSITATHFGVNPADIQIKNYLGDSMLILDGEFTVDTTAAEYAGIRPMKLTVADLPFDKSRTSTALVTAASDGVNYCTLAKVWIADKNTICIGKILPYKSLGSYKVRFSTIFIPMMKTGLVTLRSKKTYEPQFNKGTGDGLEVFTTGTNYWEMLVFKADNLVFDEDSQTVEIRLPGFSTWVDSSIPIIYSEGLWNNLGSKRYPATIKNGILTISKDGAAAEASNASYKFSRMVFVRDNS